MKTFLLNVSIPLFVFALLIAVAVSTATSPRTDNGAGAIDGVPSMVANPARTRGQS